MTGLELCNLAALDLRDHVSQVGASHGQYPLVEKLARLKSGLRFLATELAREGSNRVAKEAVTGSTDWPATVTVGQEWVDLPSDHLAVLEVYVAGQEQELGPLAMLCREDRFGGSGLPMGYWLSGGQLFLSPTPTAGLSLRLRWAAWPALVLADEPADEATAETQLGDDLPTWCLLFVEQLRQYIVLGCANRQEYDTTVEQGLYQMLKTAAQEVAAQEDLPGRDYMSAGGLWTGR